MAEKVDLCTQRLDRAHKLIGGLGDEKDRWGETVTQFDKLLVNVIGDVIRYFISGKHVLAILSETVTQG